MDTLDLQELIQDDIICAMVGWSNGGDSIAAEHINDCVSDLCDIVVNRIEEFNNEQERASKVTDEG
jgi:hypothetical protein